MSYKGKTIGQLYGWNMKRERTIVADENTQEDTAPANGAAMLRKIAGSINNEAYKATEAAVKGLLKTKAEHLRAILQIEQQIKDKIAEYEANAKVLG